MKKISTLFVAFLALLSLGLSSCKMNISQWTPDNNADPRYSVKVALAIDVEVYPSEADTISIERSDDSAPFVKVVKKDSTYVVLYDLDKVEEVYGADERFDKSEGVSLEDGELMLRGIPFERNQVLVKLGLKDLRGLCSASYASILCKGEWTVDTLSLASHSGGKIKLENCLSAGYLAIESSSSGRMMGTFEVQDDVDIELSSGAKLNGIIKAKTVNFEGSSGSKSKLRLDVRKGAFELSSGAKTELSGQARELILEASSGADIEAYVKHESVTTQKSSGGSIEVQMLEKSELEAFLNK